MRRPPLLVLAAALAVASGVDEVSRRPLILDEDRWIFDPRQLADHVSSRSTAAREYRPPAALSAGDGTTDLSTTRTGGG